MTDTGYSIPTIRRFICSVCAGAWDSLEMDDDKLHDHVKECRRKYRTRILYQTIGNLEADFYQRLHRLRAELDELFPEEER